MKINLIYLFLFWFCSFSSFAQSDNLPLEQKLRKAFENIDKSHMKTGFLLDQGLHIVKPNQFDGTKRSLKNASNSLSGNFMYAGLLGAQEAETGDFLDDDQLTKQLKAYKRNDQLAIAIVNAQADKFKEDAATSAMYTLKDNRIYADSKMNVTPFELVDYVFGIPNLYETNDSKVEVIIPKELYQSNKTSMNVTLEVSMNQDKFYMPVKFDQPFTWQLNDKDVQEISIRITDDHGNTSYLTTEIKVNQPKIEEILKGYAAEAALISPELGVEGLDIYVYYNNPNGCETNQIRKPLIFVEGFDPNDIISVGSFDDIIGANYGLPSGASSLRDELENGGYDLIFINWSVADYGCNETPAYNNGSVPIMENVPRIKNVINWVNAQKKVVHSNEENVLIGASMGGIVSKLALLQMEASNVEHECSVFITIDSPLKGANIPLGLQAMVFDLYDLEVLGKKLREEEGIGESIASGFATVNAPAAKDQLIYHYGARNIGLSTWSDQFYSIFDNYGELEIEHIALANGAQNGVGQLFGPGANLLDFEADTNSSDNIFSAFFNLVTNFHLYLRIYAYPGSSSKGVYERIVQYSVFFPIPFTIDDDFNYHAPGGLISLDAAPGGMRPFNRVAEGPSSANGSNGCPAPGALGLPFKYPSYNFVPTYSALDGDASDLYFDYTDTGNGDSDSDYYIGAIDPTFTWDDPNTSNDVPQVNQEHVRPTGPNINFLNFAFNEGAGPSGNITNRTYNFGKGDQYLYNTNPSGGRSTPRSIDNPLNIYNNGSVHINRDGKIGYSNVNGIQSLEGDEFNVNIKASCTQDVTLITIGDKGSIEVGQKDGTELATLTVSNDAKIVISAGGVLDVNKNCKLVIDDGAVVEVKSGGVLSVYAGDVIVKPGGKLIIEGGGSFKTPSKGKLTVDKFGMFTIHSEANISLDKSSSIAKIKGDLIIKGSFKFSGKGYFDVKSGSSFELESDWSFQGSGKTTRAIKLGTNVVWDFGEHNFDVRATQIEFSKGSKIKLNEGAKLLGVVATFKGDDGDGEAFDVVGLNRLQFIYCDFEQLNTAVTVQYQTGVMHLIGCKFKSNSISILTFGVDRMTTSSCTFEGDGKSGMGVFAIEANEIYSGGDEVFGFSEGFGIYLADVNSFTSRGSTFRDNFTAIYAPYDGSANVMLMKNTVVKDNVNGVNIEKGYTGPNGTMGLVLADCAKFLNNTIAIQGEDIELQVDALINCEECPLEEVSPNHFVGNSTNIQICYVDKDNDEAMLRGNYWGGPNPPSDWSMSIDEADGPGNCASAGSNVQLNYYPLITNPEQGCYSPPVGPHRPIEYPTAVKCDLVTGTGETGISTVKDQYAKGYYYYRTEQYDRAYESLSAVSAVKEGDREKGSYICRHYVDVARALKVGYTNGSFGEGFDIDLSEYEEYLPAGVVEGRTKKDQVQLEDKEVEVFPNPTTGIVNIEGLTGNSTIEIYSVVGELIQKYQTTDSSANFTMDVQPGLYMMVIGNDTTATKQTTKIVVQ